MDFLNKAIEQAKALEKLAADAAAKSYEQAQPLIREGVTRAQELQRTIVEQTPNLTAAAQTQANAALQHAGAFIATGKTVLEAGAAQAGEHMTILADQAKKAAEAATSAVQQAAGRGSTAGTGPTGSAGGANTANEASTASAPPPGTGTPGSAGSPTV